MKTNEVCGRPLDCFAYTPMFLSEVFILNAYLPFNYAEVTNPAINRRSFPQ